MLVFQKLTRHSDMEHAFDGRNFIIRLASSPEEVPFQVRGPRAIPSVWSPHPEGWILRTSGNPVTVKKLLTVYGDLAKDVAEKEKVDWRLLIVQSACEASPSRKNLSGKDPLSPRTEVGYPLRTGENDRGSPDRDVQDKGRHCSFGLCQTLLSTAMYVCPELFRGVSPEQRRFVLADPKNSFACISRYYHTLAKENRDDLLRTRVCFGAGGVYETKTNRWGVHCYDTSVLEHFLAFWGDLADLLF